jgi:hypothetical protein
MRYVIIRDDDTNASTPVECLERLYRPALDRGMPINLATIPEVSLDARNQEGGLEGFLRFKNGHAERALPVASNLKLIDYLRSNDGYEILQHGLHHSYLEFERLPGAEVNAALDRGTQLLLDAGFERPQTFVAPYDKFSSVNLGRVAEHFRIVSSGWYELGRLPRAWWLKYAWKKLRHTPHWRVGHTLLLSHPGCLLSCFRGYRTSLDLIRQHVKTERLTVLVTHWWEYFREGKPDDEFISFLHEVLDFLASEPGVKVIRFSDLLGGEVQINS